MSLIISLGSNLGDKCQNLKLAKIELSSFLTLEAQSSIYHSPAVDYLEQPDFYNQVLQFKAPNLAPQELIEIILDIEKKLGRIRNIDKGPRTVDIDVLFWDLMHSDNKRIIIPHPRLFERSFICLPLKELPYYQILKQHFVFPETFNNCATKLPQ